MIEATTKQGLINFAVEKLGLRDVTNNKNPHLISLMREDGVKYELYFTTMTLVICGAHKTVTHRNLSRDILIELLLNPDYGQAI